MRNLKLFNVYKTHFLIRNNVLIDKMYLTVHFFLTLRVTVVNICVDASEVKLEIKLSFLLLCFLLYTLWNKILIINHNLEMVRFWIIIFLSENFKCISKENCKKRQEFNDIVSKLLVCQKGYINYLISFKNPFHDIHKRKSKIFGKPWFIITHYKHARQQNSNMILMIRTSYDNNDLKVSSITFDKK